MKSLHVISLALLTSCAVAPSPPPSTYQPPHSQQPEANGGQAAQPTAATPTTAVNQPQSLDSAVTASTGHEELLARARLTFTAPPGFQPVATVDNDHWNYDFAYASTDGRLELRYAIAPLDEMFGEYQRCESDPDCTMVNPNNMYQAMIMAGTMNISADQIQGHTAFEEPSVRAEFNAHWGAVTVLIPRSDPPFAGYKYGVVLSLHRDNLADVMILGLTNDMEALADLWLGQPDVFHALRFAEPL